MKYPAIVKPEAYEDVIVLVFREEFDKNAIHLEGSAKGEVVNYRVRENLKNITAEYLADTYGEVKNKEHAEFIVKLAEVAKCAGLEVAKHKIANAESFKGIFFNFYNDNGTLWFSFHYEIQAKNRGEKQITIPLPPECESVDEWPKVGDEVQTSDGVGSVKLLPDSKGYYVISIKDEYYQYQLDELSKPKTPEQELRDLLLLLWEENNHDFDMLLDVVTEHVIKKPQ